MSYALIKDGLVVNVIEADAAFVAALTGFDAVVETDTAGIGWRWDGQQLSVPEPAPPEPAPVFTKLTKLGFRSRFIRAEKTAIELASLDDPAAAMAQRAQAADVRVYLADVAAATYIDPQRADTRAGVQALEAAGLIGAGRALEILDAPIQADEAFTGLV